MFPSCDIGSIGDISGGFGVEHYTLQVYVHTSESFFHLRRGQMFGGNIIMIKNTMLCNVCVFISFNQ